MHVISHVHGHGHAHAHARANTETEHCIYRACGGPSVRSTPHCKDQSRKKSPRIYGTGQDRTRLECTWYSSWACERPRSWRHFCTAYWRLVLGPDRSRCERGCSGGSGMRMRMRMLHSTPYSTYSQITTDGTAHPISTRRSEIITNHDDTASSCVSVFPLPSFIFPIFPLFDPASSEAGTIGQEWNNHWSPSPVPGWGWIEGAGKGGSWY